MLETIHRHNSRAIGLFITLILCFAMAPFGVDMFRNLQGEKPAIKIGDTEITTREFYRERQMIEEYFRRNYGQAYEQIAKMINISQQTTDSLIERTLLSQFAGQLGFVPSPSEVSQRLKSMGLGAGSAGAVQYRSMLKQLGISAKDFDNTLGAQILQSQVRDLLHQLSGISNKEIEARAARKLRSYDLSVVKISPTDLEKEYTKPTPEQLEKFYAENNLDYQLPARIAYQYVVLDPNKLLDLVSIEPEDIELFYAEHESEFKQQESLRARIISINVPSAADDKAKAEIQIKAEEIHQKLMAGSSFEELAKAHSDDLSTKDKGGDLGWLERGKIAKEIEQAAFGFKKVGIVGPIANAQGFHLLKVEEYNPERTKELAEVQEQIVERLKRELAPSFVTEQADGFFRSLKSNANSQSLADFSTAFSKERGLSAEQIVYSETKGLIEVQAEALEVSGLTARLLQNAEEKVQLVELGSRSIIANITEYKEPEIPALASVEAKLLERYKSKRLQELALERAAKIVETFKAPDLDKDQSLSKLAASMGIKSEEIKAQKLDASHPIMAQPDFKNLLTNLESAPLKPQRYYQSGADLYLVQVNSINLAQPKELAIQANQEKQEAESEEKNILLASILARLKAKAQIEVNDALIGGATQSEL